MPLDRAGVGDSASEVTGVKTRKTSADVFKSAIQRKVSTFSALHAWKRSSTGNDNVAKDMSTSAAPELELKSNNPTTTKEENGRVKPPRITLSVHKMTPIPSVELDDDNPEQVMVLPNEDEIEERLEESPSLQQSLPKNPSLPEMTSAPSQGRGILKKNSVVEFHPAAVEPVEDVPVDGEGGATVTDANHVVLAGGEGEPKKEILLGRTVKFDMPSFDSQTSEEIPEIVVEVIDELSTTETIKVLSPEEKGCIKPEGQSKDDICEENFKIAYTEGNLSDTLNEVMELATQAEKDVEETIGEEEEEEEEELDLNQLRQQRKMLRNQLKVILRTIVRNNCALRKQGVDMQEDGLNNEINEKEEDHVNEGENCDGSVGSQNFDEGVRHTLVLPRAQFLPCPTCPQEPESKVPKRRHSCPALRTCFSSSTEEKEEAAFAQTFLCRYREDEDFEDEGLGLGVVASQLPLLQDTAIIDPCWQKSHNQTKENLKLCAESMESVVWDLEGMAKTLIHARETHMV